MLDWLGLQYMAKPAQVDETPLNEENPLDYVSRVSRAKAGSGSNDGTLRLGADTIVVVGNTILGKPLDQEDARRMLLRLRGNRHQVHTALWLDQGNKRITRELCTSSVDMRNFAIEEMEAYISSGDALDKAGAYGIQHSGFHPADIFRGCMANVMGLPLCHLKRGLNNHGIDLDVDITVICGQRLTLARSLHGFNVERILDKTWNIQEDR